jgi:3,2-trans-enoyl-CoA isomerase
MTAASSVVTTVIHKDDPRIAILTLHKEPVNSMNLAFWQDLLHAVESIESNEAVRCIIFQSGLKKNVFTAGLDLQELYAPMTNEKRQLEFWGVLSKCLVKIYGSRKLTVAAVAGACPAGGCCLSLCCDVRVITEDGSMGLNEVALGIPVPKYWIKRMQEVIGHRETERLLLGALMPKAPELLRIGMVDHVLPLETTLEQTRTKLLGYCVDYAQTYCLNFPELGFSDTKGEMRKSLYNAWLVGGPIEEAPIVWKTTSDKRTVEALTNVLKQLQKKSPKANL